MRVFVPLLPLNIRCLRISAHGQMLSFLNCSSECSSFPSPVMNACRVPSFMKWPRKENFWFLYSLQCFFFFFLAQKPTWWLTLTNSVCFPQPGVSVAGQITPDHLAFGQNADEDGDGDGRDDNGHQELPVLRGALARRGRQSVCKRGKYDSWSDLCSIINLDCGFLCCVVVWTWFIMAAKLKMKE